MANVTIELSGDEANLFRSLQKVIGQQDKMQGGFGKVRNSANQAGDRISEVFGTKAVQQLQRFQAGMSAVQTAFSLVASEWRELRALQENTLRSPERLFNADRALTQIALDAQDLAALRDQADSLAGRYGISREDARRLIFSGRSEGFEGAVDFIAQHVGVVDPTAAAGVAGQLPTLFKGRITPEQAVNATLVAAEASRLNFEQVAAALPQAAEGAAVAGASPAETIAALSVLAGRFKSGETAADRLKGFGVAVGIDERFKGRGILGSFRQLQALPEAERAEFLGKSAELNTVFAILSEEIAAVEARQRQIEQAIRTATGPSSRIAQKRLAAQQVFPNRMAVPAGAAMIEAANEAGVDNLQAIAGVSDLARARLKQAGAGYLARRAAEFTLSYQRFAGNDDPYSLNRKMMDTAGRVGMLTGDPGLSRRLTEIEQARLEELRAASDRLNSAATALEAATGNMGRPGFTSRAAAQQREAAMQSTATE